LSNAAKKRIDKKFDSPVIEKQLLFYAAHQNCLLKSADDIDWYQEKTDEVF